MRRSENVGDSHVSMATAAAVAYRAITGEPLATTMTAKAWNDILDAVAHALSNLCPVYSQTEDGKLVQIPYLDLVEGKFDHGAAILRQASGTVHRRLTISRQHLHDAIVVLKHVGASFDRDAP